MYYRKAGVTLIELMVAVLVMLVLLGIAVPLYSVTQRNANLTACRSNILAVYQAEEAFRVRHRTFTTDGAQLATEMAGSPAPHCPARDDAYVLAPGPDGIATGITITCPSNGGHTTDPVFQNGTFSQPGVP